MLSSTRNGRDNAPGEFAFIAGSYSLAERDRFARMSDAACIVLPASHPMTDEPVSLPHTPARTPTTRLFNGGLLSLPQQPGRNPPVFIPLGNADGGMGGDATRKCMFLCIPVIPEGTDPQVDNVGILAEGTQEDQDETDEKARRKAMSELVQSWMDRLQLISVITTFFAAMEAQLLGSTMPDDPTKDPPADQVANAALTGALVVHVFAAIISFLAAFFLIRPGSRTRPRPRDRACPLIPTSLRSSPPTRT
ncbi:hypothetical protein NUW54_g14760 [Trametes sanguinea]|uniref:Uncharacterized protein n=1 Tax=Trametes sanguinea TaxID=158606 RepID=A0ACC1MBP5_9APHY|nr:hypothetical protein NUW54_g14760 [Trametes sanguinea]